MYAHCLFCNRDLGRNEAIEAFPVGRRLAYDAAKGRLWVVCVACGRWNLTPLEERWEAIEQAERLFRGARLRASTDNVGLARVAGAADLVRVGRPTVPELATWRYADLFTRRRRRAVLASAAALSATALVTAALVWGAVGGGVSAFTAAMWLRGLLAGADDPDREEARLRAADDEIVSRVVITSRPVSITGGAVRRATLRYADGGLALTFPFGRQLRTLVGDRAEQGAAAMLTHLNRAGAPQPAVDAALDRLVAAGSAEAFLSQLGRRSGLRGTPGTAGEFAFPVASESTRLALEIALNEGRERRAMEGELSALEQAWRDAETIAAIADDLVVPGGVRQAFDRLRRTHLGGDR